MPITFAVVTGFLNNNNEIQITTIRLVLFAILYDNGDISEIIVNATTLCKKFKIPSINK
jgi:hypothetical protein